MIDFVVYERLYGCTAFFGFSIYTESFFFFIYVLITSLSVTVSLYPRKCKRFSFTGIRIPGVQELLRVDGYNRLNTVSPEL